MSEAIQFNVDAALSKLGEMVAKHGPQAVDLAAQVVQVNAVNTLVGAVGWAIMTAAAAWGARWCFRRFQYVHQEVGDFDAPLWLIPATLAGFATLGCLLGVLFSLTDVWAWVALFNPKLALAHQVLAKFAGLS